MNKGLEALKEIDKDTPFSQAFNPKFKERIAIIEKELKALEIIKEKQVNVRALLKAFTHNSGLVIYNSNCEEELTQEEYELLKEIL